ncbi:MAG TPA: 50S ribosomal protein L17 [Deltaproteobacteria bacterium]|jgi:large subunit ribosomal protein L17|nr:50S ribosomal protein L17 [Deltaproteobacteria bacterium]
MRHANYGGKLGRTSAHRNALFRNMVTSLLEHERIETTDAKAREVRRIAERMITLGKRGDLHARRHALRVIRSRDVAAKVFGDLAERFRERAGGYTRVVKHRVRVGDAAPLSIVELVAGPVPEKPQGKGRRPAAKAPESEKAKSTKAKTEKKAAAAEKPARKRAPKKKPS